MPRLGIFVTIGIILALLGWGGLAWLVIFTLPTLEPRWMFFFSLTVALSGTALPIVAFLNKRFTSKPPADGSTILRQAVWVAIYGTLLMWLQLGRILNPPVAIFLATGFILIEFFIRLRERARWKPEEPKEVRND